MEEDGGVNRHWLLWLVFLALVAVRGASVDSDRTMVDSWEVSSPDGKHSTIVSYGECRMQLHYRHRVGDSPVLLLERGRTIVTLWSPDSKSVVVWESDDTTTDWCTVYLVEHGTLVRGAVITERLRLAVAVLKILVF
jgi:hypothetical protein